MLSFRLLHWNSIECFETFLWLFCSDVSLEWFSWPQKYISLLINTWTPPSLPLPWNRSWRCGAVTGVRRQVEPSTLHNNPPSTVHDPRSTPSLPRSTDGLSVLNWIIFGPDSMKKWIFKTDRPELSLVHYDPRSTIHPSPPSLVGPMDRQSRGGLPPPRTKGQAMPESWRPLWNWKQKREN